MASLDVLPDDVLRVMVQHIRTRLGPRGVREFEQVSWRVMGASRTGENLVAHIHDETVRLRYAADELLEFPDGPLEQLDFEERRVARVLIRGLSSGGLALQQQREHVEACVGCAYTVLVL